MTKEQFNILLIEDNPTDVLLVKSNIEKLSQFKVFSVDQLSKAFELLEKNTFDVVLLDLCLPDAMGLEGLVKVRRMAPDLPVVVLTGISDEEVGVMALQRGAQDYLIKGKENARLVKAIRYAIERLQVGRPNLSAIRNRSGLRSSDVLTEKELQVLRLLGKGMSNQEIADNLTVSITTVKTHVSSILQKLSVSDRTKAVVEALQAGLI